MACPVDTNIWIKCHEESSYRKIFMLMEDEDFMAQFHDTLQNKILESACDGLELTIAMSAAETGEKDTDVNGALEIAKKLTTMFVDITAMVDAHVKHGAWRKTCKDGICFYTEYCRDSYYSDGSLRANTKEALLKFDSEDEIWQEWMAYQPSMKHVELLPEYRDDWKVLADLSDMTAKGTFLDLMPA